MNTPIIHKEDVLVEKKKWRALFCRALLEHPYAEGSLNVIQVAERVAEQNPYIAEHIDFIKQREVNGDGLVSGDGEISLYTETQPYAFAQFGELSESEQEYIALYISLLDEQFAVIATTVPWHSLEFVRLCEAFICLYKLEFQKPGRASLINRGPKCVDEKVIPIDEVF